MASEQAFEEKVHLQLQNAKVMLERLEASAKGKIGQADIEVINQLKAKRQEIEKRRQELMIAAAKAYQMKVQIDIQMSRFNQSLDHLDAKVKSELRTK